MMKKAYPLLFSLLLFSLNVFGQSIQGPTSVFSGSTHTYTYSAGNYVTLGYWTATGGTLLSSSSNGSDTNIATIRWDAMGSKTVVFTSAFGGTTLDTHTVTVNMDSGTIGGAATICYNGSRTLTNTKSANAGSSGFVYLWKIKPQSQGSYQIATGDNNNSTYSASNITVDTDFRRYSRAYGTSVWVYTTPVKVTVRDPLQPSAINSSNHGATLCVNDLPGTISGFTATGGNGSYTYRWRKRVLPGSWGSWQNINNTGYTPGPLLGNTQYQREVKSCGETRTTNVITIYLVQGPTSGGGISTGAPGSDVVCAITPTVNISSTGLAVGGSGVISYQWYRKQPIAGSFSTVSGQTAPTYNYSGTTPTGVSEYKRLASNCGGSAWSNTVSVQKLPFFHPGTISGPSVVCAETSFNIQHATDPAGAPSYTYEWEKSTDGSNFTPIGGSGQSLTITSGISTPMHYRRWTISSCLSFHHDVFVDLYPDVQAGTITSPEHTEFNCIGFNPVNIGSNSPASGGDNNLSYQWQSSINMGSSWQDISGATGLGYNPPAISVTTWYQRVASSGCIDDGASSNIIKLSAITPTTTPVPISGQSSAYESGNVSISFVTVPSLITEWQYNDGSGWAAHPAGSTNNIIESIVEGRQYQTLTVSANNCGPAHTSEVVTADILNQSEIVSDQDVITMNGSATVKIVGYAGRIDKWQKKNWYR